MKIIRTTIPEVKLIEPQVFADARGFLMETFREQWFRENVADRVFVQENHSFSHKGVLRGLHYQRIYPQGKLIRVVAGEIFDVAVDVRKHSATFGQWVGARISADNKRQVWVPEGFAHGFYVVSEYAEVVYKCTDYYRPDAECTLQWDDATVGIDWPLEGPPVLSDKDKLGLPLVALGGLSMPESRRQCLAKTTPFLKICLLTHRNLP